MAPITYKEAAELLDYEPDTGELRWKVNRSGGVKAGDIAGYTSTAGYIYVRVKGRLYSAHRLAWLLSCGRFPEDQLDHINRSKSDNRISNLREVDTSANHKNMPLFSHNTSGFAGINWDKDTGKWLVRVQINQKTKNLGRFADLDEAVSVRKLACKEQGYHENHGKEVV